MPIYFVLCSTFIGSTPLSPRVYRIGTLQVFSAFESPFVPAMADVRTAELITAACDAGGSIHTAINHGIDATLNPGGTLAVAINDAIGAAIAQALSNNPAGDILQAIQGDFNQRADHEFPWRARLRALGPVEFANAWKNLVVDPDHLHALSEAISENPQMATIMALEAASPNNAELTALRRHTAMKHAPRVSWKSLCLPSHGGGSDRLQVFLGDRAEVGEDNTRALARSILTIYHIMEKRHTVQQNLKKNAHHKAEIQRVELMGIVYETIKAYKRRTCKPSAANDLHTAIFMRDFGMDLIMAQSQLITKASAAVALAAAARLGSGEPPRKAPRVEPPVAAPAGAASQPLHKSGGRSSGTNRGFHKPDRQAVTGKVEDLRRELAEWVKGQRPGSGFRKGPEVQQWLDAHFRSGPEQGAAMAALLRQVCRNCLIAGRGVQDHGMRKCREMGNRCCVPCSKCSAAAAAVSSTGWRIARLDRLSMVHVTVSVSTARGWVTSALSCVLQPCPLLQDLPAILVHSQL